MADKLRIPLAEAEVVALEILEQFRPVCTRIEIAGSIRRRKPDVGDVEIVLIPVITPAGADLFGDTTEEANLQFQMLEQLVAEGIMADRLGVDGKRARGPKMQRMTWKGFPVDLFCVTPESWGVQFAIRTGSADFSKAFMTPRPHGHMPFGMRVEGGRLLDRGQPVDTFEERDFFAAIGMAWVEPEDRS